MPKPDLLLLDKQLAFAEFLKIEPIIIINKIDLEKEETVDNVKDIYTSIGYKVIVTNAKEKHGIEDIIEKYHENLDLQIELTNHDILNLNGQKEADRICHYLKEEKVLKIHSNEPTLEDIFKKLTGKRLDV